MLSRTNVKGASFFGVREPSIIVSANEGQPPVRWEGADAIGYLRFRGAKTDDVALYHVYRHHPKFEIVEKICRKLSEQANREKNALVQRGVSGQDTTVASGFLEHLRRCGWVVDNDRRGLVGLSETGREHVGKFVSAKVLPPELAQFLAGID